MGCTIKGFVLNVLVYDDERRAEDTEGITL